MRIPRVAGLETTPNYRCQDPPQGKPRASASGILRTLYDSRTLHGREVFEEIARVAPEEILQTYIKRTVRLAAAAAGETILTYAKDSDAAHALPRTRQGVKHFDC